MDLLQWVAVLLPVAGILFAVWVCLPDLLLLLGLTRIRQGIEAGPEGIAPSPANPVTDELEAQLTALGFVPAGVYWETIPAHKIFKEYVFASKTTDCFATVYKLFDNDPPRVAFFSGFTEKAFVLTQNYHEGTTADEPTLLAGGLPLPAESRTCEPGEETSPADSPKRSWSWLAWVALGGAAAFGFANEETSWWKWGLLALALVFVVLFRKSRCAPETNQQASPPLDQRDSLPEVLAEHRRRLAHLRSLGCTLSPAHTIEDFLQAQQGYHNHATIRWQLRSCSLVLLPLKLAFLSLGPAIVAAFLDLSHPLVWTALIVPSLAVLYFRRYGFPLLVVLDRVAEEGH